MDWNSTTEVVMAMAVSDSGKTYVVARYSPQGNFVWEFPYWTYSDLFKLMVYHLYGKLK